MVRRFPDAAYPRASRAHLHAQAGRHQAALDDYDALLRLNADDARTWFNKGFVLELLGRWDEALAAFRRATELSPELDRAWYGLGLVLIRMQRFDEADRRPEAQHRTATDEPATAGISWPGCMSTGSSPTRR